MTDRLDAIYAFIAVCDEQGFAAAARRLQLSPSVVTRLVASLEQRLGVRLFQRTTRTVRTTEAGVRFLERARRIVNDIEEAELSAQEERARPRGLLTVAAPLLFGRMHVAPLLATLLETHPQLSADLRLSDRLAGLVEEGVDVAIRIGNLADSGLIARRLGQTRRVLVASPAYLEAKGGPPRQPSDLVEHDLIAFEAMTSGRQWSFRGVKGEPITVNVAPRFLTNSGDAAINHALADGGITAAFCYQVDAAIRAGSLVQVLGSFSPSPVPIQALFPTSRLLSSKVRAFLELAERAAPNWKFLGVGEPWRATKSL